MIVGRCRYCNYTARYNSNYFTILELKIHIISFSLEKWECIHSITYEEEKQHKNSNIHTSCKTKHNSENLIQFSDIAPTEVIDI